MRVYLPATLSQLAEVERTGSYTVPSGLTGHAVTPALREWYTEGDLEELEYVALLDAASSSLRALAADPDAPRRRVVLAADVPDAAAHPAPQAATSAVTLAGAVPLTDVVSVHVDEDEAVPDVAAAVDALPAADAGDDDAQFTVDSADGHDLLWYDVTEIKDLLA
ncbi:MAG TPA: hypothetical protein VFX52_00160 [Nocardioidaceae bacterium]|jgi:hypothetical protein|nr:hypothetical protein [Nocardioidaceae bacterium]